MLIIPAPRQRRKGHRALKITPEQSQFKFYQIPSQNKKKCERGRTGRKGEKEKVEKDRLEREKERGVERGGGCPLGGCPLHKSREISTPDSFSSKSWYHTDLTFQRREASSRCLAGNDSSGHGLWCNCVPVVTYIFLGWVPFVSKLLSCGH